MSESVPTNANNASDIATETSISATTQNPEAQSEISPIVTSTTSSESVSTSGESTTTPSGETASTQPETPTTSQQQPQQQNTEQQQNAGQQQPSPSPPPQQSPQQQAAGAGAAAVEIDVNQIANVISVSYLAANGLNNQRNRGAAGGVIGIGAPGQVRIWNKNANIFKLINIRFFCWFQNNIMNMRNRLFHAIYFKVALIYAQMFPK